MNTAILFLVFNRPDVTRQSFAAIRAARPARLYVAADGPRPDRPGEAERCAEVRRIATDIDWPCELKTLFRPANLGCKMGVSGGIDWFFTHEEEGIILEDDVLPHPSFFPYCAELLERYRDDPTISLISGCNLIGPQRDAGASYLFSRYLHIWGWGSWRRTWQAYDVSMAGWPSAAANQRLATVLDGRRDAISYWSAIFDRVARGEIDTWDYQLVYSSWMNDRMGVMPAATLIDNIGFGVDATHTVGEKPVAASTGPVEMRFPLVHPRLRDTRAVDARVERLALQIGGRHRVRAWLRRSQLLRRLASGWRGASVR